MPAVLFVHGFCLSGFDLDLVLFFPDFLFDIFSHIQSLTGFWAILVLRIFGFLFKVQSSVLCELLHFSVFENFSFWLHVANSLIFYTFENFSFWLGFVLFCLQEQRTTISIPGPSDW